MEIVRLAWAEFWKAFKWRVGVPSARDFFWLTLFFALSSFLMFFGWSARQGVWQRFEQVLLGALPDSGPPIRVGFDIERPERITAQLIDAFAKDFPGLSLVPMRDFDGKIGTVVLPGTTSETGPIDQPSASIAPLRNVSRDSASNNDADLSWGRSEHGDEVPFRAFAVPLDAPIWRWIIARGGRDVAVSGNMPLLVAASRSLFSQHFRYERYRTSIINSPSAPCVLRSMLPEHLKDNADP